MNGWKLVLLCCAIAVVAGLAGGVVGAGMVDPKPGPQGEQGAEGPQGPAGPKGDKGDAGDEAPSVIGVCYSTTDNITDSGVLFVTSVYLSSPFRSEDGTTSCLDGTYVSAIPAE